MQATRLRPTLPLWMLILIVGIIVGVSMGRAQSMGLYLTPITQALGIGREVLRPGNGAYPTADGPRRAACRRIDR